jgi:hypothetical protein
MMLRRSFLASLISVVLAQMFLLVVPARAQVLGTFRWQLAPFCNVVSLSVTQNGGVFMLDGFDDQCGAVTRASVVGTAFPNPDGSIGIGLSIVATPGAAPVHVDVALSLATIAGPWRDSAGNTGTFLFNPVLPAPGSPRPPTGGLISTVTPGAGLTGGGTTGVVSLAVAYGGSGAATTAAHSDHTHATAGTGNTAVGESALTANVSGSASNNTAVGSRAMSDKQSGNNNVAIGHRALGDDIAGNANVAIGRSALTSANSDLNTAVGYSTLNNLTTGTGNTALGANAGTDLNTGSNNIYLGAEGATS